jgi:diguanylate cyclase
MRLFIKNRKQVLQYTALITLIAVGAPVLVVGGLLIGMLDLPLEVTLLGLAIAFLIPTLIAPPIAYIALSIMRLLHETIVRVEDHVRFDALTGALNRSHFLDTMRQSAGQGVLMILDVDHFKQVNDTHGHAVGDEVLRTLAHTIKEVVGSAGVVGRLGGEEFAVFLADTAPAIGLLKAEAIRLAVASLGILVEGRKLAVTVSIGCVAHRATAAIGISMKTADTLLYEAKKAGRNRVMPAAPAGQLRGIGQRGGKLARMANERPSEQNQRSTSSYPD